MLVADLFPEVALIAKVESCHLHKEHHNIDYDCHKLVMGCQQ